MAEESGTKEMTTIDYINEAKKYMEKAIESTNCGYCKMIVGDSKSILDKYTNIIDTLNEINETYSKENDYLTKVDSGIRQMYRIPDRVATETKTEPQNRKLPQIKALDLDAINPFKTMRQMLPGIIINKDTGRILGNRLGRNGLLRGMLKK